MRSRAQEDLLREQAKLSQVQQVATTQDARIKAAQAAKEETTKAVYTTLAPTVERLSSGAKSVVETAEKGYKMIGESMSGARDTIERSPIVRGIFNLISEILGDAPVRKNISKPKFIFKE